MVRQSTPERQKKKTNLAQAYVKLKKKKMRVLREQQMRIKAADSWKDICLRFAVRRAGHIIFVGRITSVFATSRFYSHRSEGAT